MLKKLQKSGKICFQQYWIEQAIYKFLENQLECKCHICREEFKKEKLDFLFYFVEDEKINVDISLVK